MATSLFTSLFAGKREVPHVGASFGVLPPPGAEPSKNVWRPRAPTWALLGAQPHSPLVRPRESLLTVGASPLGEGEGPAAQHGSRHAIRTPRAGCAPNQTSNQTSARGLVSWPRLPRFAHFPFHFPFRGEKGSALSAGAPRGAGERKRGWAVFHQPPSGKNSS